MTNPYSPSEVARDSGKPDLGMESKIGLILASALVFFGFVFFFLYGLETSLPVTLAFALSLGLPIIISLYFLENRVRSQMLQVGIGFAILLVLVLSAYLRSAENQKLHSAVERLRKIQLQNSESNATKDPREPSDEPKSR